MATITQTYASDQHNNWATGITIPSGQYISSISFTCDGVYNESASIPVTLYIGGVQMAVCQPGSHASFSGSASGNITATTITANYNYFSFRSAVTFTYTLASSQVSRTITKKNSPSAGGSFTTKKNGSSVSSAYKNDTIAVAASANSGYVFKKWTTSPSGLISASTTASTTFKMPDQNVTVTANWWKLSTGSLNKTNLTGGGTVKLTITAQTTSLSHKYKLSFGTGMETGWVDVAAGTTSVNITVPLNWSATIPNATSKSGGTLTLRTYNGSTNLGNTTITGLTYMVPDSVVPTIGTITTSIIRTIGSITYGNIGDIYVQNHCGVRTQASASGAQSSTIAGMTVSVGSYGGSEYVKTVTTGSIDFTSGLLSSAGACVITVTATDSRGRTATQTATITVEAYSEPSGSLQVWRVDGNGDADDMGTYGKYELTKQYSQIGTNSLTWTLAIGGDSESSPADTGDLLPSDKKTLNQQQEYTVALTLADGLETVLITATVPSARFILAFASCGNKVGVMKFPNQTIPSGKARTFEFSADTQIYIGNQTLEDYIASIVSNM